MLIVMPFNSKYVYSVQDSYMELKKTGKKEKREYSSVTMLFKVLWKHKQTSNKHYKNEGRKEGEEHREGGGGRKIQ